MTVLKVARNITQYRHIHTATLHSDVDGVPQIFSESSEGEIFTVSLKIAISKNIAKLL
jgi:hypothetical protein